MNWVFTSAFCRSLMLEECLTHLYSNKDNMKGFHHVVIDQHYPFPKSSSFTSAENSKKIKTLCYEFGCIYVDSLYDRGLHRGINYAMSQVGVKPGDIFIGCDPDDRPSDGAFHALKDVMRADPKVAVAGLNFWVIPMKLKEAGIDMNSIQETIGGHRVFTHPSVEMFNVVATNTHLIVEMGGFHQPNDYYGGIEIALHAAWAQHGMKLVYLLDHTSEAAPVDRENPYLYDKTYGMWKIDHATKGFKGSYKEWLQSREIM